MTASIGRRRDKLIKEKRHDMYREVEKRSEPTTCPECRAVFTGGRWSWQTPPAKTSEALCPACRRVADGYPAGYIEMKGPFFAAHRDEIMNLVNNVAKQEKGEHPLERIMSIENDEAVTLLTTTGIHVARRIGEALASAYNGDFSFQYGDGETNLRVYWER